MKPCIIFALLPLVITSAMAHSGESANPAVARFEEDISFYLSFAGSVEPEIARGATELLAVRGEPRFVQGLYGEGLLTGKEAGAQMSYRLRGNLDFTRPGTMTFWMSPVQWLRRDGGYRRFISVTVPGMRHFMFIQRHAYQNNAAASDRLQVLFYYFPGMKNLISTHSTDVADGQWRLLAVSWDEESYKVYIDGKLSSETHLCRPFSAADFPVDKDVALNLGGGGADNTVIDEFTVYDRKLQDEEITEIFFLGVGEEYILDAQLHEIPAEAEAQENGDMKQVSGRLPHTHAVNMINATVKWQVRAAGRIFVEYWLRPTGWDAAAEEDVDLAAFKADVDEYRLYKAGGVRELILSRNGVPLQMYPVYKWVEQEWMGKGDDRERWHHISINFDNDGVKLYVDGFAARTITAVPPPEAVAEFCLSGDRGTTFADLRIARGSLTAAAVRTRYLHLFSGQDVRLLRMSQAGMRLDEESGYALSGDVTAEESLAIASVEVQAVFEAAAAARDTAGDSTPQPEDTVDTTSSPQLAKAVMTTQSYAGTTHRSAPLALAGEVGLPAGTVDAQHVGAELTEEQMAYSRRWSRDELEDELEKEKLWNGAGIGVSPEVMSPWTPMEVRGQEIHCWGRIYSYDDTLLPAQVMSQGDNHLQQTPYLLLRYGGRDHILRDGKVEIEQLSSGLVRVRTEALSGPFTVKLETDYEFDGMAKVKLTLSGAGNESIEHMQLVFHLKEEKTKLFHYITSSRPGLPAGRAGHPPLTDAGYVSEEGFSLNIFRHQLWLGDTRTGFAWFAEGLNNWQISDENAIQVLTPVHDGARQLVLKFADRGFTPAPELQLVFGFQATPMRPRKRDFRRQSAWSTMNWNWFWGDGQYYPFHLDPAPARQHVADQRQREREVMPCSSLLFYGTRRFYESRLGKVEAPGLLHKEVVLWSPLWRQYRQPDRVTEKLVAGHDARREFLRQEKHTADGEWYGERYQPKGLTRFCPNSPFQDYYIWRLEQLVQDTGLAALYLDQPVFSCFNHHHGCGYTDYAGQTAPTVPIFALREMAKRVRRIFTEAHGDARIKWHMSNQLLVPAIAFADSFWDGENYGQTYGGFWVQEFYSRLLTEGRMLAQHTGVQFGFAPHLLPQRREPARTSASVWDMMGLFWVHDNNVSPIHTTNDALVRFLQRQRLSYNPDDMHVEYYWERNRLIALDSQKVKYILHHGAEKGLLILFNWSDDVEEVEISIDAENLFGVPALRATDIINKEKITDTAAHFRLLLAARDVRLLQIARGQH